MIKRGKILRDTNVGPGLLTVEGRQYIFTLEDMWRSDVPPRTGMTVDAVFDPQGALESVAAVSEAQVAREGARKALDQTTKRGSAVAGDLKARLGIGLIVVEVVMLLGFFVLPSLRLGEGPYGKAFSGWEVSGLDAASGQIDHGLLSLLAIAGMLAPIATPFVKRTWARWLNMGPLAFCLIAVISVMSSISSNRRATAGAIGSVFGADAGRMSEQLANPYGVAAGTYLVILCAVFLAARVFRTR